MAKKPLPSPDLLRQLLGYDPETGRLWWKPRPVEMFASRRSWKSWHTRCTGIDAFTAVHDNGYLVGNVLGQTLRAHRVIWAIVHGYWPVADIDHINGDRKDNKLSNLREASRVENLRNLSLRSDSASGVLGVHHLTKNGKWRAHITVAGVTKHLGEFGSKDEAIAVRASALRRLQFHPNHGKAIRP